MVGEADCRRSRVAGSLVTVAFDEVAVVSGAFDDAGVGTVTQRVEVAFGGDLADEFGAFLTGDCAVRPARSIGTTTTSDSLTGTRIHFRIRTGYKTVFHADHSTLWPGRASPVPAATVSTFCALYAGESLAAATFRFFTASMGLFAVNRLGSPPCLTTRQASLPLATHR